MFCVACRNRSAVTRHCRRVRQYTTAGTGYPPPDSPLRRLLDDATDYGETSPVAPDDDLHWATQPYSTTTSRTDRTAPTTGTARNDATVLLFPGQGSERVGMGRALRHVSAARDLYALASDTVGWDVWRTCTEGPLAMLRARAQTCVTVTSLAALERAREERPSCVERAVCAAGYSVGEVAALVFGGALQFEDALRLLEVRTAAMQAAAADRAGGMLTVWLSPDANIPRLLAGARDAAVVSAGLTDPVCDVAIYLYAGCKVLAGDDAALQWVSGAGGTRCGVRRAVRVRTGGAWHCSLMEPTRHVMRDALTKVSVRPPHRTVYSCSTGTPHTTAGTVRRALETLAVRPVRWEQTLHALYARPRDHALPLTLTLGGGGTLRTPLRHVNARAWDVSVPVHDDHNDNLDKDKT